MRETLADRLNGTIASTPATNSPGRSIFKRVRRHPGRRLQPQIIWELKGLGRLSADMQFAPNGQILLPLAGKLASVDPAPASGHPGLQWNVKAAGGNLSYPVCTANGSIYAPSSSSIQELEPDGALGWAFTVYPSAGGTTNQWLGYGQGKLYFPLASGLYILDPDGQFDSLSPWDSSELQATKLPLHYNFLAGTVTAQGSWARTRPAIPSSAQTPPSIRCRFSTPRAITSGITGWVG